MSLIVKNAKIVNADGISDKKQNVLVEKGVISKMGGSFNEGKSKVIDAKGKYLMPGFIDIHAHLREPGYEYKETIESGSQSAARGGFTSVFCMPNTKPAIDNRMVVEGILKEAKRVNLINIFPIGSITKGQKGEALSDFFELKEAGCLALSDDGRGVQNSQIMRHAMEYAHMAGMLLIQHCEEESLFRGGVMHEGFESTLLGLKGIPGIAETIAIARDIELSKYLNIPIHFAHVSLKRSVDLIKIAKSQGVAVTCEVCPHHFTLTDRDVRGYDTHMKVNPPLRAKEDVEALKKALKYGVIDCIATDHAPHSLEDKELEFDCAPFGMIGFETAFGLTMSELVDSGILTLPQVVEKMSLNPAKLMGLEKKGIVMEGKDADFVIVDPDQEWVYERDQIVSKSKNSPFIGRALKGAVEATICGGKVVYERV